LIANLPGSPTGALESLEAIEGVLDHALETLAGPHDHDATA
jgi:molybdopterin biosynthesis enzyme MoaB